MNAPYHPITGSSLERNGTERAARILDRKPICFLLNPTNDESDKTSNTHNNTNTDRKVRAVRR